MIKIGLNALSSIVTEKFSLVLSLGEVGKGGLYLYIAFLSVTVKTGLIDDYANDSGLWEV